jgi:hypothetical protein
MIGSESVTPADTNTIATISPYRGITFPLVSEVDIWQKHNHGEALTPVRRV